MGNYGLDTTGEKEKKRTSKKNMDGRSTSSHYEKFRTRSMEKRRGTTFGFRKTATAAKKTGDRQTKMGRKARGFLYCASSVYVHTRQGNFPVYVHTQQGNFPNK
jgi:hypothetical protein